MSDLRRVEVRGKQSGQAASSEDKLLSHLCEQLGHFIEARQEMMELYLFRCLSFLFYSFEQFSLKQLLRKSSTVVWSL